MNEFTKILKYINLAMAGYAAYRFIRMAEHCISLTSDKNIYYMQEFPGFGLTCALIFGPSLFFLYLTGLNYRSVRLRLLNQRPVGLQVPALNTIWLILSLIGIAYYTRMYADITTPWLNRPSLSLYIFFAATSILGALYLAANAFHGAWYNPRLGPRLRRTRKSFDRQAATETSD